MALLSGKAVCDEVAWRIENRVAANATGPGSIIDNANRILGMISSASSWAWEQQLGTLVITAGTAITGDTAPLAGADIGKEIALFNVVNGMRIERAKTSDTIIASASYVGLSNGFLYNTFRLSTSGANNDPQVVLYPSTGVAGSVTGIWHVQPPTLLYNTAPTVLWNNPSMDLLLIDWTDALMKKHLGMAGWQDTWMDCVKRVAEFRVTYASQRENTGPEVEEEIMSADKQTGRD